MLDSDDKVRSIVDKIEAAQAAASSTLAPYKFQVVAICQRVNDGKVIGEEILASADGSPIVIFGVEGLAAFAEGFEQQLADLQASAQSQG